MTSRRSALPHTAAHRMRLIPRQPGSWAMVLAPAIAAITLQSGFHAITMSCLVTLDWALCYGMQYAINRWIVAGARRRYAREAFICTAVTVAFGIPTLIIAPGLLRWAPWFAALLAVTVFSTMIRHDTHGIWSQVAGVIASCTIPATFPSAANPSAAIPPDGMYWWEMLAWWPNSAVNRTSLIVAIMMLWYEIGSLLFVRSMIREFGNNRYRLAAIAWHAVMMVIVITAAYAGMFVRPWAAIVAATALVARVGAWDTISQTRPAISRVVMTECLAVVITTVCTIIACLA